MFREFLIKSYLYEKHMQVLILRYVAPTLFHAKSFVCSNFSQYSLVFPLQYQLENLTYQQKSSKTSFE